MVFENNKNDIATFFIEFNKNDEYILPTQNKKYNINKYKINKCNLL